MIVLKSYSLSCCHISWSTCRCFYSTCSSPREKLLEKLSQPTSRICGFSRVEAPVRAILLCGPEMGLIPCWGHFQTKATEEDNCKALTVRMPGGLGQPWKCQPWHFQIAWVLKESWGWWGRFSKGRCLITLMHRVKTVAFMFCWLTGIKHTCENITHDAFKRNNQLSWLLSFSCSLLSLIILDAMESVISGGVQTPFQEGSQFPMPMAS